MKKKISNKRQDDIDQLIDKYFISKYNMSQVENVNFEWIYNLEKLSIPELDFLIKDLINTVEALKGVSKNNPPFRFKF